ncbi:hypothetical protein KPL35_12605 [Clostridium sp. CF011]|uniref:hypothetical protein n=1 Tax=unclassified Clostridium TaxID=2614128 RepID=UPI001C0E1549|nr:MULTISPECIES: hypothetical protein [unclassified Clostridium]MBU3092913.1 hypothetical protein [Clostridium sp. CF011]MBW9146297.1 hypothetical protein [Clostridium sp. CM027]UVE41840.1 hypothetical protein KTC92_05055 [Clostridium sp. CM027]WAG70844.1 hypothetical protein LL036_05270 [Clostridium sp. CF011]
MKKRLLIIALIISFLFATYAFINQKIQRKKANEVFIHCIYELVGCFGIGYSKVDEEDKISYYMEASAYLHTAISILPFTSYANVENKTGGSTALSKLYMSISINATPQSTNRSIAFTEKEEEIQRYLYFMSINPNDKENWDLLSKIAVDIGY